MDEFLSYTPVFDEETQQAFKQQFARIRDECYVNHAGGTLHTDDHIEKSANELESFNENPDQTLFRHKIYSTILDHFHTSQDEYSVIFTSSATNALNLLGEMFNFKYTSSKTGNLVYLQDNHNSVIGMGIRESNVQVTSINQDQAYQMLHYNSNPTILEYDDAYSNSLFIYPAQSNFSGLKYPLSWIENVKEGCLNVLVRKETNWFVLLDATSFAGTNDLNLSIHKPDFVYFSFDMLFGHPTDLGALLIRNDCENILEQVVSVEERVERSRNRVLNMSERIRDQRVLFPTIVPLKYGFQLMSNISMQQVSEHVFSLAKYFHHSLLILHHENGAPVAKLYADTDYENKNLQGGIVTFNLLKPNGEYVGYTEVVEKATVHNIHLCSGSLSNPGSCKKHFNFTDKEYKNFITGNPRFSKDVVNGKPTGAVRVSFGYMSTIKDVEIVLNMINAYFVDGNKVLKLPIWWSDFKLNLSTKYRPLDQCSLIKSSTSYDFKKTNMFIEHLKNEGIIPKTIEYSRSTVKLVKILIYPVKFCGEYEVSENYKNPKWKLTSKGLLYDKQWVIRTSAGVILTQKQEPKLCLIRPIIDLEYNQLIFNYPDMPTIKVPLGISAETLHNKVCKSQLCDCKIGGIDCGEEISKWLSSALNIPDLKLVRLIDLDSYYNLEIKDEFSHCKKGEWMITCNDIKLTLEQEPELLLLEPMIDYNQLTLHYPGMPPIKVSRRISLNNVTNEVSEGNNGNPIIKKIDCGEEVSEWLSLALQRSGVKLIRQIDVSDLKSSELNNPDLSSANRGFFSFLNIWSNKLSPERELDVSKYNLDAQIASSSSCSLINLSTIKWLSNKLSDDSDCDKDTMFYRFRGNLIVDGGEPFEEFDSWSIEIEYPMLGIQGMFNTSPIVGIDQKTGKKTVEPLRTINEEFSGKLKFRIYLDTSHINLSTGLDFSVNDIVYFMRNSFGREKNRLVEMNRYQN